MRQHVRQPRGVPALGRAVRCAHARPARGGGPAGDGTDLPVHQRPAAARRHVDQAAQCHGGHGQPRAAARAAAGALAVEMGYISENEMPTLPGQIALDPERVTNVVETLNEVLESFGRKPARTVEELDDVENDKEADEAEIARRTLDAADAVLDRLRKMTEEGA